MQITVEADAAGTRIDRLLAEVDAIGSRARAERLIDGDQVLVNGRPVAKSQRVRTGDVIEVPDELLADPAPVLYDGDDVPVLYQDDDVVVVDKPAGMVVHPAPGLRAVTLVELLVAGGVSLADSDDPVMHRPGVVHRLDKDTTGVIVLAKNPAALRNLQEQIRARDVRREYLALVQGHVSSRAGRIEAPIGPDVRDRIRRSIDTDAPKDAVTHFVVTEILPSTTLLRINLETGRTHQIRVHFQAIGNPVVGDPLYGGGPSFGLDRQFLHAAHLTFAHPRSGEPFEVTAPLPDDLQLALSRARRDDQAGG